MNTQGRLISRYTQNLPAGRLEWIGLRKQRREPLDIVQQAQAIEEKGLEGDHRCEGTRGSARQVTLISLEHITLIAHFLGCGVIEPEQLRRNLVVSGINLNALRYQKFRIGEAEFEATALCHPCSRMEQALGPGAVAAMLGYGGLCAKITKTGIIKVGDRVEKC